MNTQQFPPYLAFGKLNEKSIRSEGIYEVADYELLGEPVMKVKQAPGAVELIETLHGKGLSETHHRDLKAGFLHHYTCVNQSGNPVMKFLVDQVCSLGNIYFQFSDEKANRQTIVYYPAAYLFIIRIPITENNVDAMIKAMDDKYLYDHTTGVYESRVIIDWKNGRQQTKPITVLELISPAAFLYEMVKWLTDRNLILREKLFRAIIQNTADNATSVGNMFTGTEEDAWNFYSILYKPAIREEGYLGNAEDKPV